MTFHDDYPDAQTRAEAMEAAAEYDATDSALGHEIDWRITQDLNRRQRSRRAYYAEDCD